MAPKKRAMRDALCALDGDDSSDSSENSADEKQETDGPNEEEKAQAQKKIRLDALERAGYSSGPSLLHIPKQKDADSPVSGWGTSKGQSVTEHSPTAEVCAHCCVVGTIATLTLFWEQVDHHVCGITCHMQFSSFLHISGSLSSTTYRNGPK